jgi:hypothetical protein
LGKQSSQRDAVTEAVPGSWASRCASNRIVHLTFEGNRLTIQRDEYLDRDCTDLSRTTVQGATFTPTNTFKEGVLNWLTIDPDAQVTITLHKPNDVQLQNNVVIAVRNENESPINLTAGDADQDTQRRNNAKIRASKSLTDWNKDEPKTLSRLQAEKLDDRGLQSQPPFGFGLLVLYRYVIDGGILFFPDGGGSKYDLSSPFEKK